MQPQQRSGSEQSHPSARRDPPATTTGGCCTRLRVPLRGIPGFRSLGCCNRCALLTAVWGALEFSGWSRSTPQLWQYLVLVAGAPH